MKLSLSILLVFTLVAVSPDRASAEQSNMGQYAYLTQDSISLTQDILNWNGSEVTIDELKSLIPASYSLKVGAYNPDFRQLMAMFQLVKDSGIEDRLITLNLYGEIDARENTETGGVDDLFAPKKEKEKSTTEPMTMLGIDDNGRLLLSGKPIELADISKRLSADEAVSFYCIGTSQFSRIYEALQALNQPPRSRIRLMVELRRLVRVEAKVIEVLADGTEKTLSSPRLTTKPGNMAALGVRDTQPETKDDLYQQNGRSGGGVSLKLLPQVIEDCIKITGSVSIKRVKGSEAFQVEDESIHNYSTETIVIPFAYVFDKGSDTVEFDPVEIGGKKIICRLHAFHVSDQGKRINPAEL